MKETTKFSSSNAKSFLNSRGVAISAFDGTDENAAKRYKLFKDSNLRRIVLSRLQYQMNHGGFCTRSPTVQLGLAAGKICGDEKRLRTFFEANGWLLLDPHYIRQELKELSNSSYENDVATITVKLLLRAK